MIMPLKPEISVKISPSGLTSRWGKVGRKYGSILDRAVELSGNDAKRFMRSIVRVNTGKMRNSITVTGKKKTGGGWDRRSSISVGPTVSYSIYVDQGAQSSPGRYVPVLGRRVDNGTHPGQQPQHFIQQTEDYVEQHTDTIAKQINKELAKAINSEMRG